MYGYLVTCDSLVFERLYKKDLQKTIILQIICKSKLENRRCTVINSQTKRYWHHAGQHDKF